MKITTQEKNNRYLNNEKYIVITMCQECGANFKHNKIHNRKFCSLSCGTKTRRKQEIELNKNKLQEVSEHKQWRLFWDYELPRMERKHLNQKNGRTNRLPSLPKDSFELATYKICELKLNTETFPNKRSEQEYYYFGKK